ncbi:MAG: AAA family ATPase [Dehalococcoidia bacterium]|nr:AAA family ATPase [Dehalococcoidia bacterium]
MSTGIHEPNGSPSSSIAHQLLSGLNAAQMEAVQQMDGPLLIVAGPGSGKTRVIVHRIAYLVRVMGVNPYRICAVTFTNKAAKEMKERLVRLLGTRSEHLAAGTFHALCAQILRREGQAIGLSSDFVIYDTDDQQSLIKQAFEAEEVDPKRMPTGGVHNAISGAKSQLITPEGYASRAVSQYEQMVGRIYKRYQQLLERSQAVDFDDLLLKTYILFREHPEVLEKWQNRFQYLMVDEFQDTNVAQYGLARMLAAQHNNICVVGDPDQAIYSWRHADVRNILSFQRDFPAAKVVRLEMNYRSTPYVLKAAQAVIVANQGRIEKDLIPSKSGGEPLVITEAYNEEEEAQWVVREVDRLKRDDGYKFSDCAVLYRVNAQSRAFEEACLRYGIPYRLVGATRFYQRKEVKDILCYLRLATNPQDEVSLARVINVPPRGIGQKTVDDLIRWARSLGTSTVEALQRIETDQAAPVGKGAARSALMKFAQLLKDLTESAAKLPVLEVVDLAMQRTGYKEFLLRQETGGEERWDNLQELRGIASEFAEPPSPEGLTAFLERIALVSDTDNLDEAKDGVTLITLHQAKGLEFRAVFLVGLEEGLLPHIRSMDDPHQLEEERRLCYVGMTRAQERLYLVRAFSRHIMGGSSASLPSRFLRDIPPNLWTPPEGMQKTTLTEPRPSRRAAVVETIAGKEIANKPMLNPGDHVKHGKFGMGVVVSCLPSGSDFEVTVAFKENGVKKLLYSLAPLARV